MEEKYIYFPNEKKRRLCIEIKCDYCGEEIWRRKDRIRKYKNYCSITCRDKARKKRIQMLCAFCGKPIEKTLSKLNNSRSGKFFCNRECKENAQSLEYGILKIGHYKNGIFTYRKKAFKYLKPVCKICGYNDIRILEVHHIDGNRENNKLNNLMVLCPTHHKEYTLRIRK